MVAVIEKTSDLVSLIQNYKQKGNTVGFVPTMGALHKGHLTLVKKSIKENKGYFALDLNTMILKELKELILIYKKK